MEAKHCSHSQEQHGDISLQICGPLGVCVGIPAVFTLFEPFLPKHLKHILCWTLIFHWTVLQLMTYLAFLGFCFLAYFCSCSCSDRPPGATVAEKLKPSFILL